MVTFTNQYNAKSILSQSRSVKKGRRKIPRPSLRKPAGIKSRQILPLKNGLMNNRRRSANGEAVRIPPDVSL